MAVVISTLSDHMLTSQQKIFNELNTEVDETYQITETATDYISQLSVPSFKSKRYRDKLRTEVKALEGLLPVDRTSLSRKLDSQTVFRLVIAFLRTQGYFQGKYLLQILLSLSLSLSHSVHVKTLQSRYKINVQAKCFWFETWKSMKCLVQMFSSIALCLLRL